MVTAEEFFTRHLFYEVAMLRETHRLLVPATQPEVDSQHDFVIIRCALMDGFAIHARALWEFFTEGTQAAYRPGVFADARFVVDRNFMPDRLRKMINNQVAHLGKLRTVNPDHVIDFGPRLQMRTRLEGQLRSFVGALREPYAAIARTDTQWQRLISDTH